LFYIKFIEKSNPLDEDNWTKAIDLSAHRAWSGYAFEQVCLYHVRQIKKALGIAGVLTYSSSWKSKQKEGGVQIDLVIDRRDHVINICEMKFSMTPYTITKNYAEKLLQKMAVFRTETKTSKALHLTMITTRGLKPNNHSINIVQNDLKMEVLFED